MSKNIRGFCCCIVGSLVLSLDLFILKEIQSIDRLVATRVINYQSYSNISGYFKQPVVFMGLAIPIIVIIIGIIFLTDDFKR
ncbi:hypothetical protein [Anaerophilus nitritogenes]|uniref:hypothetical protein n=1 Tax=Anaerophilus nitritogenes TaxID=2498136 RepID=UPI00101CA378|nr:hypothetical protein [Anaerophilus nitritogenes]